MLYFRAKRWRGSRRAFEAGARSNGENLIAGHIDPGGMFYYSCRNLSATYPGEGPANAVAIFKLDKSVTDETIPLLTSTDPVFVQSECN
jgi:hypothetical protein